MHRLVDNFYRDMAVVAYPQRAHDPSQPRSGRLNWEIKSGSHMQPWNQPRVNLAEEHPAVAGEEACAAEAVVDLTSSLDAAGRLDWHAPPGDWIVIRFGYTLLGSKTKCVSPGSQGYEIDFLSQAAMDMHFAETGGRLVQDAGPLAGTTLKYFHDDSYEVGADVPGYSQPDWTPGFREEFRRRRGYDLLPYLPVLAGKIVGNREHSNRFLWDCRRTIGDLFVAGHYGRFRDLAHPAGVGTHPESGGPFWPHIDALQCLGTAVTSTQCCAATVSCPISQPKVANLARPSTTSTALETDGICTLSRINWTVHPEPGIKYYSGKATYVQRFDLPPSCPVAGRTVYLDLGVVKNLAEVRLNGVHLGVVWTAPWRVDITGAVQTRGNQLEADVVNLWPNRLIGDAGLPPEQQLTVTNVKKFTKDSPLLESGLLGPVTIQAEIRE